MPDASLIQDAGYFAVVGLVLALLTMWRRRDLRGVMAAMSVVTVVGVVGLMSLARFGGGLGQGSMPVVLREVALLVIAIGVIRIFVMFAFEALLYRVGVPKILAEVLLAVMMVVYALYRMNVAGVNLATIVTTSTVLTGVIAFSLQAMVGNLWGGIALQMDNTCRIGDWIRIEGVSGQVVSIRWRYLSIATNSGETVMIPNAQLINNRVTVLARRADERIPWRRSIDFSVAYDQPPSRVIEVVEAELRRAELPNVAAKPPLQIMCSGFGDSGVKYDVWYWLTDLSRDLWTDSQVRTHVSAALARHGMEIPYPHQVQLKRRAPSKHELREEAAVGRLPILSRLELFASLTADEKKALASELVSCPYVGDDMISRQGEAAESLFVLAEGAVDIYREEGDPSLGSGQRTKLATLTAPGYFGEMGLLTGQARTATVMARGFVLCYRLDKLAFDAILRARPELADAMSKVLGARQAANDATLQAASADARARQASSRSDEMLRRIRDWFGLSA